MSGDAARDAGSPRDDEALPELPSPGYPLADTHAHLDMLDDPAGALAHAAEAGVGFIATVVDMTEAPEHTLDGLDGWLAAARERLDVAGSDAPLPRVRVIAGVHPHNASRYTDACEQRLRAVLADPRVCAIGEVGLDFHYDNSPREDQRAAMRRHIALAHETGLPVCVHLREAHDEGLAILAEAGAPAGGCLLHCFTEGPDVARRFLDAGCLIAFGGVATFPKAGTVREAASMVPLERMLIETDCPFLTPAPFRGRTNEPAFVTLTAARLAELLALPGADFARATTGNALALLDRERAR